MFLVRFSLTASCVVGKIYGTGRTTNVLSRRVFACGRIELNAAGVRVATRKRKPTPASQTTLLLHAGPVFSSIVRRRIETCTSQEWWYPIDPRRSRPSDQE